LDIKCNILQIEDYIQKSKLRVKEDFINIFQGLFNDNATRKTRQETDYKPT